MMNAITSFTGQYRFLSNFYPAVVTLDGIECPTVEHAYQAAKTIYQHERATIIAAPTPGAAKRAGRRCTKREDWDEVKLQAMLTLLRKKFAHPALMEKLLATGDAELIEGNTWGDTYWGRCNGVGENHLGRLLMQVRAEINAAVDETVR